LTALVAIAILLVGVLLTLAFIYVIGHWVPDDVKGQASDSWAIFAFCGVLYSLVIGFVLAFALDGYQGTRSEAGAEAHSVTALSRSATLFGAEDRDRIGHELICYARAVIDDEWPRMADGERSVFASAASDRLFQSLGRLGRSDPDNAALGSSLDRLRVLGEARAARLQASNESLPAIFWVVLAFGGLLLIGYATILAGRERRIGQFIYILPVSLLLLSTIYLVAVFQTPFSGPNRIEPTSMENSLRSVTAFVPDPRADRPCP